MGRFAYLDAETFPVAPGLLAPPPVCFQVAEDDGEVVIYPAADPRTPILLDRILQKHTLVGHNIAYDLAVAGQKWPHLMPLIWKAYDESRVKDTMIATILHAIAEGVYNPRQHSLAAVAERYAGRTLDKSGDTYRLRYGELHLVPLDQWPAAAVKYARDDVDATRAVWLIVSEANTREIPTLDVQVRAAWALHLGSCWGMVCDADRVAQLQASLEETRTRLLPGLVDAGLMRPNGSRIDAAVRKRAQECGAKKKTEGGQTSISADALLDVNDPVLRAFADYQHAGKVQSTYLPVLVQGTTVPVQPRYGIAESGRATCSAPNLQNLPVRGGVRECFRPRAGYAYVAADYHMIELFCLSQVLVRWYGLASCKMAQALLQGLDLHLLTASSILGWTYADTRDKYRAGDEHVKRTRDLAKKLNFGIPGGAGIERLRELLQAAGFLLTVTQVKALRDLWLQTYPEMRLFFDRIAGYSRAGTWRSIHPITGYVRGGLSYCDGANQLFQHPAAHGAKVALYAVQRACFAASGPLAGSRLVAFVHDECLLEVRVAQVADAADALVDLMQVHFGVDERRRTCI